MANGGISPSGRALRFVLWRAPMGAAKYTAAGFLATTQDVGRRWLSMAGLGLWVWVMYRVAQASGIEGFRQFTAFLMLLWFWRLVVLVRWTYGLRVAASRARAAQRKQIELLQQLPGQIQQFARQAIPQGGGFTVLGMKRQHDPVRDQLDEMAREQADQVRQWTGNEVPIGDKFEPLVAWPKFLRRGKKDDQ